MPVRIPNSLPAAQVLKDENIFVMTERRARIQEIRPLKIAILNLMPTKEVTETQLLRLIGNTPLQVDVTLLRTASYQARNVSSAHLDTFYKTFDEVRDSKFDGLIITGAPVEMMDFEEVQYWNELTRIMDWPRSTYSPRCTSAGRRRPACTTVMACPSMNSKRNARACTATVYWSKTVRCCAALTIISSRRTRAIPRYARRTS